MNLETLQIITIFVLLAAVFTAFVREWFALDIVALGTMVILLITGILNTNEVLSVFSNQAPITIACMFVLSAALERTGVIDNMGKIFSKLAGAGEIRSLLALLLVAATASAFMNNTPVVVVFLPIVLGFTRHTGLKASKYLIPLSYAAILGGTCTLIGTSTNLIVDGIAQQHGQRPFGMFEISKLGVVYAVVGMLYIALIGRKLLPAREILSSLIELQSGREFLTEAVITRESPLVGKTLPETPLAKMSEMKIIEVKRKNQRLETRLNQLKFAEGDQLLLTTVVAGVKGIKETTGIEFQPQEQLGLKNIETQAAVLMEGIIGPHSTFVGKNLKELNFRQRYGVLILAVHRQGVNLKEPFQDVRLAFGDTLLVEGPAEGIHRLLQERDFLSLSEPQQPALRRDKAPIAIIVIALMAILSVFNILPITALALAAAVVVMITRCLDSSEAYESIEWKIIFLIIGMLALGLAMEKTNAAQLLADGLINLAGGLGPVAVLSMIYFVAMFLTEIMSNNAVAALLTPIAVGVANNLGLDPRPFIVAIMFASSASFATSIGYQTNTYVYGAGGYRFKDFLKIGIPLNIILWIVATFLIPVFWPLK